MSFENFQRRVRKLVERAGGLNVRFSAEDGKFFANISDGTTIIGNSVSPKVAVKWGTGHVASATI